MREENANSWPTGLLIGWEAPQEYSPSYCSTSCPWLSWWSATQGSRGYSRRGQGSFQFWWSQSQSPQTHTIKVSKSNTIPQIQLWRHQHRRRRNPTSRNPLWCHARDVTSSRRCLSSASVSWRAGPETRFSSSSTTWAWTWATRPGSITSRCTQRFHQLLHQPFHLFGTAAQFQTRRQGAVRVWEERGSWGVKQHGLKVLEEVILLLCTMHCVCVCVCVGIRGPCLSICLSVSVCLSVSLALSAPSWKSLSFINPMFLVHKQIIPAAHNTGSLFLVRRTSWFDWCKCFWCSPPDCTTKDTRAFSFLAPTQINEFLHHSSVGKDSPPLLGPVLFPWEESLQKSFLKGAIFGTLDFGVLSSWTHQLREAVRSFWWHPMVCQHATGMWNSHQLVHEKVPYQNESKAAPSFSYCVFRWLCCDTHPKQTHHVLLQVNLQYITQNILC